MMILLFSAIGKTSRKHHNCLGMRHGDGDEPFNQVSGTKMVEDIRTSFVLLAETMYLSCIGALQHLVQIVLYTSVFKKQ